MKGRGTYIRATGARVAFLIPTLLLQSADLIQAQDLYFGARTGASFTTFAGDDASAFDSYRTGFLLGGVAGFRVSDHVAVETETTWIQKGADGILQGFEESLFVSLEMDYLQVPLLARLNLPRMGQVQPQLLAGPTLSFELDCDVLTDPGELALTLGCDDMSPEEVRSTVDWGLVFGAGTAYDLGRSTVFVDGRYDLGLTNLAKPPLAIELMNRGFSVSVGMTFLP